MNVLVSYMSDTGNTKKVAEAIYGEIDEEKTIVPIKDLETIEGYDLAFLGFPIKQMGPDKKTVQILKKHCIFGRRVVLFITHAAPEDAPDLPPMLDKFSEAAAGAEIVDMFDCQGELSKSVKRIMSIMPSKKIRHWAKTDCSQGQPDESRIAAARAFARETMADYREKYGAEKVEVYA
jgi:flavodoxin